MFSLRNCFAAAHVGPVSNPETSMTEQYPGDSGISALVDIARTAGLDLNADQRLELERLISDGLVAELAAEPSSGRPKFKVTGKGQRLLDDRGIGANES
jgi:hypothetical protein